MSDTRTEPAATAQIDPTGQRLERLGPARLDFRDATGVRAIIAAADAVAATEDGLRQAVAAALGTSKQAAHERFRAFTDH